ncbi:MAG TPA: squalene synthase HpnC [Kribbella sp.]|nr:squalene synthase HpnC [Kribbella sp.]
MLGRVTSGRMPDSAAILRGRERAENFPVALRALPGPVRQDLHAVYAFARTVDDLGDRASGDRTAQLHALRADLSLVWRTGAPQLAVHRQLVPVVRRHALQEVHFRQLVEANLLDQQVTRYETLSELLGYCALSANPVGRIVLGIFDSATPRREALSDKVCSALQVLEHCQDVREDALQGRIYLPQQDLRAEGVDPAELGGTCAGPGLRGVVLAQVEHASSLLDDGAPLVGELRGWARLAVAAYVAGGRATVDSLRRTGGDVLAVSATPRRSDLARHLIGELARRRRGGVR